MLAELAAHKEQTGGSKPAGMRKELQAWVQKQRQQKKLFDQLGTESMTMTQDRRRCAGRHRLPLGFAGRHRTAKEAEVTAAWTGHNYICVGVACSMA